MVQAIDEAVSLIQVLAHIGQTQAMVSMPRAVALSVSD